MKARKADKITHQDRRLITMRTDRKILLRRLSTNIKETTSLQILLAVFTLLKVGIISNVPIEKIVG